MKVRRDSINEHGETWSRQTNSRVLQFVNVRGSCLLLTDYQDGEPITRMVNQSLVRSRIKRRGKGGDSPWQSSDRIDK